MIHWGESRLAEGKSTTQTGIPIAPCVSCGCSHPVTRKHCPECGSPSLFAHEIHDNGMRTWDVLIDGETWSWVAAGSQEEAVSVLRKDWRGLGATALVFGAANDRAIQVKLG